MTNPGASITERAHLLAREKQITFRAALQELSARGRMVCAVRRRRAADLARKTAAHVSSLERQGLF